MLQRVSVVKSRNAHYARSHFLQLGKEDSTSMKLSNIRELRKKQQHKIRTQTLQLGSKTNAKLDSKTTRHVQYYARTRTLSSKGEQTQRVCVFKTTGLRVIQRKLSLLTLCRQKSNVFRDYHFKNS